MNRSDADIKPGRSELLILDQELVEQKEYWIGRLSNQPEPVSLFLDHARRGRHAARTRVHEIAFNGPAFKRLVELTGGSPFLIYTTLMAALKICLYKYTENSTIVVGSPARKPASGPRPINALAIVNEVDESRSFKDILGDVRQTLLDAYTRQAYPYQYLIRDLGLDRVDNKCPLFNLLLSLESIHGDAPELKQDITIKFDEGPGGLTGVMEFDESLFSLETVSRFGDHFLNGLKSGLENPSARVADIQLLGGDERKRLVVELNSTFADVPLDRPLNLLFEDQVKRTPDACALVFKQQRITYGDLNRRANRLARYIKSQGVGPDALVGICMERGLDPLVATMAVLKAGAAYLPMDSEYPQSRLDFMMRDSGINLLITQDRMAGRLPDLDVKTLYMDSESGLFASQSEDDLESKADPDNLAYVIYTSGSTGQPNGVMITHRAICNLINATISVMQFREGARALQVCSTSFDGAVLETFSTLLSGGTLYLTSKEERLSSEGLTNLIRREEIEMAVTTPPILSLLAAEDVPSLRTIAVGGERCLSELANRWCGDRFLLNIYGPTETTIYCLSAPLRRAVSKDPPIGRQVQNMTAYLLDRHLYPVPMGVPGEIFVSGVGLSRGYLNRPAMTAEKFIPNPFSSDPGQRLYRTGDLGRYLPDGQVEFLGRLDNQVKVKGYRMELEEIETVLSQCPGVASAVVLAREGDSGEQELVAYVANDSSRQAMVGDIRRFLHDRLPNYMIPSSYVLLESMPVTTHGKIDRKALPAPDQIDAEMAENFTAPRTPVEEMLAGIWAELLNLDQVNIHDNFFDLGGRSLNATQLMSRIRNTFQIELPLDSLFNTPTVEGLAALVEKARSITPAPPIRPVPRNGPLPLSFAQQRLWFLHQITPPDAHDLYNGPLNFRLQGALDVNILERILREIITRHEPLRTSFQSENGQPVQVIEDRAEFSLPITDLRGFPQDERELEASRLATLDAKRPFDLSKAPLMRAELLRLDEQDHILLMTIHHIVFDIWSMGVFVREILALYEAFSENRPSPLPDLRITYADFAQWQRQWLQGEVLEKQLNYWRSQLADITEMDLPADYPRPERPTFKGDLVLFQLPSGLSDDVRRLSRQEGATQFMVLLAAFNTLLYRYTGREDVVTSTAIANRNRSEIEPLIGFFVNTLVLRTSIAGGPTFRDLIGRVRKVTLDAYAHQDLPFERIVEELRPERDASHAPMFRTMIGLLNIPTDTNIKIPGLKITQFKTHNRAAKFDIILRMTDREDGLRGEIEYDTDLFKRKTVEDMVTHFKNILEAVTANPDIDLIDIPFEKNEKEHALGAPSNVSGRYIVERFDF